MAKETTKLDMSVADSFIGTKIVRARPCSKSQWMKENGQVFTEPDFVGYKVQYEDGYISWSPKSAFDKAYRKITGMNFGQAVEALRTGKSVTRKEWDGFLKCDENNIIEYWIHDINYGQYDVPNDDIFADDWMICGLVGIFKNEELPKAKGSSEEDDDPDCVKGV